MSRPNKKVIRSVSELADAEEGFRRVIDLKDIGDRRIYSDDRRTPLRGGTSSKARLGELDPGDLGAAVRTVLRDNRDNIELVHVGNKMRAADVFGPLGANFEDFYGDLAQVLLAHAIATWRHPVTGREHAKGRQMVIGKFSGDMAKTPLNERAMRVGKALMTMAAEMIALDYDPSILLQPEWHPAAIRFLRAYVGHGDYEHAIRFEIRGQLDLRAQLLQPGFREFAIQRYLPEMLGEDITHGPDILLHQAGLAYAIQLKAYKDLAALFLGPTRFDRVPQRGGGGPIQEVIGPDAVAQTLQDLVRTRYWDYHVPGAAMDYRVTAKPPNYQGWDQLATEGVCMVDDLYYLNHLMSQVSRGVRQAGGVERVGNREIVYLGRINRSVHGAIRELMGEYVRAFGSDGDALILDDPELLWNEARRRLRTVLREYERQINEYLAGDAEIASEFGGRLQRLHLLASSEGAEAVLTRLDLPDFDPTP